MKDVDLKLKDLLLKLSESLQDGRNGVHYHWHPWVVQDMMCVIKPVIENHFKKLKPERKSKTTKKANSHQNGENNHE